MCMQLFKAAINSHNDNMMYAFYCLFTITISLSTGNADCRPTTKKQNTKNKNKKETFVEKNSYSRGRE